MVFPKTEYPFFNSWLFDNPALYGDQISILFLIPDLIPSNSPWLNADSIFFEKAGLQSG